MDVLDIIEAGSWVAFAIAGFEWLQRVWEFLSNKVVATVELDHSLATHTVSYLDRTSPRSGFGSTYYDIWNVFVKPLDRDGRVITRSHSKGNQLYWFCRRPIWLTVTTEEDKGQKTAISFFRGTIDFEKLLLDIAEDVDKLTEAEAEDVDRFRVYHVFGTRNKKKADDDDDDVAPGAGNVHRQSFSRHGSETPLRWSFEDLKQPKPESALAQLSLTDETRAAVKEIKFWFKSKAWYLARGIPWRRGYLFHGRPGAGKTSLARALAQDLGIPIWSFDLASMTNEDFSSAWTRMAASAPCIALIEDIDAVFSERQNMIADDGLTFDCLLNSMDGVERTAGILTIVTTNNVDELDEALCAVTEDNRSSRPGRIDKAVEFQNMDEAGRQKMAARILQDQDMVDAAVVAGVDDTGAQFQERCMQMALSQRFSLDDDIE